MMSLAMMTLLLFSGVSAKQDACMQTEQGNCISSQTDEAALVQKELHFRFKTDAKQEDESDRSNQLHKLSEKLTADAGSPSKETKLSPLAETAGNVIGSLLQIAGMPKLWEACLRDPIGCQTSAAEEVAKKAEHIAKVNQMTPEDLECEDAYALSCAIKIQQKSRLRSGVIFQDIQNEAEQARAAFEHQSRLDEARKNFESEADAEAFVEKMENDAKEAELKKLQPDSQVKRKHSATSEDDDGSEHSRMKAKIDALLKKSEQIHQAKLEAEEEVAAASLLQEPIPGKPLEAQMALDLVQAKFPPSMANASLAIFNTYKGNFLGLQSSFDTKLTINKMIAEMTLPNQQAQIKQAKVKDDDYMMLVHDAAWQEGKLEMLKQVEEHNAKMKDHCRESCRELYYSTQDVKVFEGREHEQAFSKFFNNVTYELAGFDTELELAMEVAQKWEDKAAALEIDGDQKSPENIKKMEEFQRAQGKAKGIRETCADFGSLILQVGKSLADVAEKVDDIGKPDEMLDQWVDKTNSSVMVMSASLKDEQTLQEKLQESKEKVEEPKEERKVEEPQWKKKQAKPTKFPTAPPAEAPETSEALHEDIETQVEKQEAKDCASAAILLNPLNCAVKGVRMLNKLPRPSTMVHKYRSWVGTEDKNGVAVYTSSDEKMQADHIEEDQKFSTTTKMPKKAKKDNSAAPRLAVGIVAAAVAAVACWF
eukprot:gnl/TRDRNA2_/TRDRNA2_35328_c0_seq1.p1 gnl/TRDRNA2_/TRDRNA2_35328_c0~~gnl/TRDRNA2_/TRDRNA2_35328_c0_seq1.p1  ORF type:complete len:707 (-),score=224.34 gnl/TRDRNA2_/TRDRNA2_35328_c0_seq1:72-2192(-)